MNTELACVISKSRVLVCPPSCCFVLRVIIVALGGNQSHFSLLDNNYIAQL